MTNAKPHSIDEKFWAIGKWEIFHNLSYGCPWTIDFAKLFVWSYLDNARDNWLISRPNYFIFFLITMSFLTSFLNNYLFFLQLHFFPLSLNIYLWRKVVCLFCFVCTSEIHQTGMLQIAYLVSFESSQWGGVHRLGFMAFGLAVQKFLNIEWFLHWKLN